MKKIIISAIRKFFYETFACKAQKVHFLRNISFFNDWASCYPDRLEGFVYFNEGEKVNFYIKIDSVFSYSINFPITPDDSIRKNANVDAILNADALYNRLKVIEELNFKLKNFYTVQLKPFLLITKKVSGNFSEISHNKDYTLSNGCQRSKSSSFNNLFQNCNLFFSNTHISFNDDFIDRFCKKTGFSKPSSYYGLGEQCWEREPAYIDLLLTHLYHNFFFYASYYNNEQSILSCLSINEILEKDHKELHSLFMKEVALNEMCCL